MIKPLTQLDVDKIIAIQEGQGFLDGWNKSQFDSWFKNACALAIGDFEGEKLCGFITLTLSIDSADIEDLLVDKKYRRCGKGLALILEAENLAKLKNITKIFLEVREGNIPAISLYEKCGFKKVSVRKKYYSDGENALVLIKEI